MHSVNPSPFNIYEQVVRKKVIDPNWKSAPTIFLKRHAISKEWMADWMNPVLEHLKQPDHPYAKFISNDFPTSDITKHFRLAIGGAAVANHDLVELDFARYSDLPFNPKAQIAFSFSVPIAFGDSHMFYGEADRGFLFAHGFFCRYTGEFSEPSDFTLENLWRS